MVKDEPPLLKRKKVDDEALVDDDNNAMQTRIRTGTISKVHSLQI